ncbi:S41 family peptidase [Parapedobacter koreensis]|uniref:C-terminal processing protease CtpA/Prc, contains a PDZ domain n=1 Tax=Parapedobacter koreensis TaxID=332977 RepID=A0A1H7SUV4_9SPHI|nr:S41 family peptidase [Parapedobacter koreensis]SEL76208.1 C-terminal processing protease CtpA/Prc, contains a PDZ domain [Parapedobacter koreensis]
MYTTFFSRLRNIRPAALLFLFFVLAVACKRDPEQGEIQLSENELTNSWVISNMRDIYYWNTSIPQDRNLDFNLDPREFFNKILHPDDRFSVIALADELQKELAGVTTTVGLGIGLIQLNTTNDVIISVRYALEGSPADEAGIKRGDIITRINGEALTTDNYTDVLSAYYGASPFTVQLAHIDENGVITDDQELELTPVEGFQEQAIHMDSVIITPTGKKVGYLFYNRFLNNQSNELLEAFYKFKTENVTDLVLDLRYNGGGGIWITSVLAGLIQANFNKDEVFIQYRYNSTYGTANETYYSLLGGTSENPVEVGSADALVESITSLNLNLSRVYIIATNYSASASELIINNLRPFMSDANVVHIGRTTVGKNEGSVTIVDEQIPRQTEWGILPIIVKLADKNGFGDYPNGLDPQYEVNETNYLPWAPIGSLDDPLLARAMSIIDPSIQPLALKSMGLKQQTAKKLNAIELPGFEDKLNKPIPVDIGKPEGGLTLNR